MKIYYRESFYRFVRLPNKVRLKLGWLMDLLLLELIKHREKLNIPIPERGFIIGNNVNYLLPKTP